MIELRWLKNVEPAMIYPEGIYGAPGRKGVSVRKCLQYRVLMNMGQSPDMINPMMQWSPWMTVPEVEEGND